MTTPNRRPRKELADYLLPFWREYWPHQGLWLIAGIWAFTLIAIFVAGWLGIGAWQ